MLTRVTSGDSLDFLVIIRDSEDSLDSLQISEDSEDSRDVMSGGRAVW